MSKSKKKNNGFTQVPNLILNNPALGLQAKGLLAILLSNSRDWKINIGEIYSRSADGIKAQRNAKKELIQKGFLIEKKSPNPVSKKIEWDYTIVLNPPDQKVSVDNQPLENYPMETPSVIKPSVENVPINNTNRNNTDTNNTNKSEEEKKNKEGKNKNKSLNTQENSTNREQNHSAKKEDGFRFISDTDDDLPF